jgi:uncharacterized protein DUF2442
MSTSISELPFARACNITVKRDSLIVDLSDGRTLSVPLEWYPRLQHGTPKERRNWRLIAQGEGIHWPALDEDISVEGLILGRRSGESPQSLERWLEGRKKATSSNANFLVSVRAARQPQAERRVKKLAEARARYEPSSARKANSKKQTRPHGRATRRRSSSRT